MFLATLKAKLIAALGGIVAIGLAILYIFNKGGKSARDKIQAKTAETIIKTVKERQEVEEDNRNIGADARRDRLFDEYSDDN